MTQQTLSLETKQALENAVKLAIGVHDNVPQAVYRSWPAMNHSALKEFARTPAHFRFRMAFPSRDTDALNLGDAFHAAILEPTRFDAEFARAPKCDRRTTAGKNMWASFEERRLSDGKLALPPMDHDCCLRMRDGIWNHNSLARQILMAPGRNERSFFWLDKETGLPCKGRCDSMRRVNRAALPAWCKWPDSWPNLTTVVLDVKTARSAHEEDFRRDIRKYFYHVQAAYYLDGLATISPQPRQWLWIVCEKAPPYLTACYSPTNKELRLGRDLYRAWLAKYKQCCAADSWEGYPNEVRFVDAHPWEKDEEDES